MKYVVGIESTAHTFGVAVLDMKGKILSNVRDSYTTEEGGMIPMEVRAHHARVCDDVFERAIKEAKVSEGDIEVVAFSNAPGLAPCLLEGMAFAKRKAAEISNLRGRRSQVAGRRKIRGDNTLSIPIVGVNHCVAHLVIGESVGAKDPVMLYASGANTQVVAFESGKFRVFGETLDLGVGNFIDSIGRTMKLGFPAGPKIEKLAKDWEVGSWELGVGVPELLELPYSVKGMDVAFSGMQTKIRNLIGKESNERLAFAMQENVFAMLVEVAERALAHTGKSELLIGGGVGCNSRLQEMCRIMCEERDVKFFCPPKDLLIDNGAMIGYLGLKMYKSQVAGRRSQVAGFDYDSVDIAPRERTDDVEVGW